MRFLIIPFLIFTAHLAFSQEVADSVRLPKNKFVTRSTGKIDSLNASLNKRLDSISFKVPGDSASRKVMHKADSLRSGFQKKADSLQSAFQKPINRLDSVSKSLQAQITKVTTLKLPSNKLTAKLDSVNQLKTKKLSELNQKMDKLKEKTTKGLNDLDLPPEMKAPIQKLTQSVNGYNIPVVNGKIPGVVTSPKIPGLNLPGLNNSSLGKANVPGVGGTVGAGQLNSITGSTSEVSKITGQVGQYGNDVKKITEGNIGDVKNLDKAAESEAMKNVPMGELKGKAGEMDKYKSQLNGRPDSAALSMVKQEAMKQATDHFAGKEVVLKEAMDKLSKLKTRYSDVKSMVDLPKKLPNPLKGKPFIERFIPTVGLQILGSGSIMLDVNGGAMYRITPRFSAGTGWVQRFAFDNKQKDYQVYGPRASVQFLLKKGFSIRFAPELVNTYIPPGYYLHPTDGGKREWVWSAFIGLKKEFKVYKRINGYTEGLYNLYNSDNKSPYKERLVVRFGFEFPLKKKIVDGVK